MPYSGYQGALNPFFVSANKDEHILSQGKVSAPKHYYPVREKLSTTKFDALTISKPKYEKKDEIVTRQAYKLQQNMRQKIKEQSREKFNTEVSTNNVLEGKLWQGYNKVLADLLKGRRHSIINENVF